MVKGCGRGRLIHKAAIGAQFVAPNPQGRGFQIGSQAVGSFERLHRIAQNEGGLQVLGLGPEACARIPHAEVIPERIHGTAANRIDPLAARLIEGAGGNLATVTARALAMPDPGAIVWDEVLAFWLILWLVMPAGLLGQAVAFALFRYFDAAKPGPVAWADRLFKGRRGQPIGWAQGFGILFDDLVAALCTLLVIAVWRWFWP